MGNLTGRTERNEIVHLSGEGLPLGIGTGDLVRVVISEAFKNSLAGRYECTVSEAPVLRTERDPAASAESMLRTDGRRQLTVLS
jgi:hypothetical protein